MIPNLTSIEVSGDQGGGGLKKDSLEVTIAVMLLLVKCYDKK